MTGALVTLLLYGVLTIASFVISVSWTIAAVKIFRRRKFPIMANPSLWVAAGLSIGAISLGFASTYRTYDALAKGVTSNGSAPSTLIAMIIGLVLSKLILIYASAINGEPGRIAMHFWLTCYALILWGLFVLTLGAYPAS